MKKTLATLALAITGLTFSAPAFGGMGENPRLDQCEREPELWFCDSYHNDVDEMSENELKGFISRLLKHIGENSVVDSDFPGDRNTGR